MLKLSTKTKLSPQDVVKRAEAFFGPGGYGLKETDKGDTCATFEGGGGQVWVSACTEDGKTSVDFETREWEKQVRDFALAIKK